VTGNIDKYRLISDDHHVKDVVAERVLIVGISSVLDEIVVDVFVAETRRECQRILAIIGITYMYTVTVEDIVV